MYKTSGLEFANINGHSIYRKKRKIVPNVAEKIFGPLENCQQDHIQIEDFDFFIISRALLRTGALPSSCSCLEVAVPCCLSN